MKNVILVLLLSTIFICCSSSKYSKMNTYYKENERLHKNIADTLRSFINRHNTEVIMRQKLHGDKSVSFGYTFDDISTIIGIGFDSTLERNNPFPERTSKIDIPLDLIKDFKKTIYHAISATEEGIFFGYEYYTVSEYEYGILVYFDDNKIIRDNVLKEIEKGVCVYKAIIP